jgi:hypothetical protein
MKEKILDFYQNASKYEKLTKLSYEKKISMKRFFFDFLSIENIKIENEKIHMFLNKQLEMFLLNNKGKKKGISPIRYTRNKDLTKREKLEIEDVIEQELFEKDLKENSEEWNKEKEKLEIKYSLKIAQNKLLFSPVY